MAGEGDSSSYVHRCRSAVWFKILVVSVAVFTDILFYGLIIPFIPIMLRVRIHMAPGDEKLWNGILLGIYGGATLIASPICGLIADRTRSRRGPLLMGLCSLGAATLFLQLGSTLGTLILGRIFQGTSAAMVYSAGLALLCDAVGQESLGEAMGYITLAITAATFVGPSLGGILYDAGGESAIFGFAYAVIAVDIVLRLAVIEETQGDYPRLTESDNDGRQYGSIVEQAPNIPTANASNTKKSHPKASFFVLLSNSRLLAALTGWLAVGIFLASLDAVLPTFVRDRFGWSATGVGLIFLPVFVPNLAGPLYGRLVDSSQHGPRLFGAAGFLISVPPFVLLRLVQTDIPYAPQLLCGLLLCIGIGLAIVGPALLVEVFGAVSTVQREASGTNGRDKGIVAQAYGLYNSALAAGMLLGPLSAGPVVSFLGWAFLTTTFGALSAICSLIMYLFLGGFIGRKPEHINP